MGRPLYFSPPARLEHQATGGHPERPERITAIESSLAERESVGYEVREAPPASREMLFAVHSTEYVDALRSMSDRGGGALDPETVVSAGSYRAAAHATDAVLFASIHQSGTFPGTGHITDAGARAGEGYSINLPVQKDRMRMRGSLDPIYPSG